MWRVLFYRLFLAALVVAFFSVCFLGAFGKAFDAENATRDGLIFGFASALAWGLSVVGGWRWNSFFNFSAGLVAAISLGYLTAIKDVCPGVRNTGFICYASTWVAEHLN
jgi:hypothetical protein